VRKQQNCGRVLEDCTESPAEIEAALQELNQDVAWDRENLTIESGGQRESVLADD